jgi:N-acetylglutamate synthase-like GNAT family acetyltransferase
VPERDETAWLRCRVVAFLDTAYFDSVEREKEHYEHLSIELVAEEDGELVGLIDVESDVCSDRPGRGAMIWHVAVHPDHRRHGIGEALVAQARALAEEQGIERFEAWTRDDPWVQAWYEQLGFEQVDSYLHVYLVAPEHKGALTSEIEGLKPARTFAHYTGPDRDALRARFERVHDCVLYELRFS